MRLAIIGSRDFNDLDLARYEFARFVLVHGMPSQIVSGGARGADTLAELLAAEYGIEMVVYKPDWKTHGKAAGFIRNSDIINNCDMVLAFWSGSNGTADSITKAEKVNKPVIIINV